MVDHPVLDASSELAAVRLVHRRRQAPHGSGRRLRARSFPTRSDVDLEPAVSSCASTISCERLVRLSALGVAPRRRARSASRRHWLVRRERRFAQREHADDADRRDPTSASATRDRRDLHPWWPARRSSLRICASSAPGHVLREHRDVVDEQTTPRVADRSELGGEALLTGRCRRLCRDAVDDPSDARQDDAAADEERDEHVELATSTPAATRTGRATAVGRRGGSRRSPGRPRARCSMRPSRRRTRPVASPISAMTTMRPKNSARFHSHRFSDTTMYMPRTERACRFRRARR